MIGCFPDPYPDELLYSVLARLTDHLQYPSPKSLVRDLLGNEEASASVHLPSHLDHFIEVLPPGHRYSVDRLIDEHTLLPFYGPFLPSDRLNQLRAIMHGRNGRHVHVWLGMRASIPLPEWLRFCPLCAAHDRSHGGETYWRRVHQAPGVVVCPRHEIWLQSSQIRVWNRRAKNRFISAEQAIPPSPVGSLSLTTEAEPLLSLARDVAWLLDPSQPSPAPGPLWGRYHTLLADRGLASFSGVVHQRKFLMALRHHYPVELLKVIHCQFDETRGNPWPLRLVQPALGSQHPICHLLLIHFLGHTAQTFFALPAERKPFGEGPWPCLNPVSDHYRQALIQHYQVVYNGNLKHWVGTFTCRECGFCYTRLGPETSAEDRFRLKAVRTFGPVWEATLQRLWADPTLDLATTQQRLGIDAKTLHQYAARLDLPFPKPGTRSHKVMKPALCRRRYELSPTLQSTYRAIFLAAKAENPEAGITGLSRKIPREYDWLKRNDPDWLQANRPPALKHKPSRKPKPCWADWSRRDQEFMAKVKPAGLRLKNTSGCPIRLTKTKLATEIGIRHSSYLSRLPLTVQALTEMAESVEEYYVRRVWWMANIYRQENIKPKRWQLVLRAGVSRRAAHPLVRDALDAALQTLDHLVTET